MVYVDFNCWWEILWILEVDFVERENPNRSNATRRTLKPSLRWGITVACDLTRCYAPLVAAAGDG